MKVKLTATAAIAMFLGMVVAFCIFASEITMAQNPQPNEAKADAYVVVKFIGRGESVLTEKMNELAADGWQYVGVVHSLRPDEQTPNVTFVAFRRPRR